MPKINVQKLVGRQAMPYGKSKVSFRVRQQYRQEAHPTLGNRHACRHCCTDYRYPSSKLGGCRVAHSRPELGTFWVRTGGFVLDQGFVV